MLVLQLGLVFLITAGLAAWICGPSARQPSSSGGLALAGGFGAGALMLLPQGWLDWEQAAAFVISGAVLAAAGFLPGGKGQRFVHMFAALIASVLGLALLWLVPSYGRIPPLPLIGAPQGWEWLIFALMVLGLSGLGSLGRGLRLNGGKAALAAAALSLPLALMAYLDGAYCHGWMIAAFAAACGGFHIYNRAPSVLLPGAGGGLWLTFTPGLLAALSAETIGLHIWLPALALYAAVIRLMIMADQKNA